MRKEGYYGWKKEREPKPIDLVNSKFGFHDDVEPVHRQKV